MILYGDTEIHLEDATRLHKRRAWVVLRFELLGGGDSRRKLAPIDAVTNCRPMPVKMNVVGRMLGHGKRKLSPNSVREPGNGAAMLAAMFEAEEGWPVEGPQAKRGAGGG